MESYLGQLDAEYAQYVDGFTLSEAWQQIQNSEEGFSVAMLWEMIKSLLFGRIVASVNLLSRVLMLSLLLVLLKVLSDSFSSAEVATLARWVVGLALVGLAASIFLGALQAAQSAVQSISDLMMVLLPVMMPLLAALGGVSTVSFISPALLFVLNLMMQLMNNLVLPLLMFSAVLRLVGHLSPRFSVKRLADLCKQIGMGAMGIMTTVFMAFLSISGITGSVSDGVAMKAVKAASGAFIPVVGRTLADSLDSVLSTVLILKNGVGLLGGIAILLICAVPAIQILVQSLMFKLAGAIVEPLGDDEFAAVLTDAGKSLTNFFAALAICGLFCFFALALVMGMGSITMMMR